MSSTLAYRPALDGLRALAVAAVILFHYNPAWLPGGFLGVDVFFVISGYLITRIIHTKLEEGRFSFADFWLRRFRRLYPALVVMVVVVAVVGHFVLISPERGTLPAQAWAALFSFSNVYLWLTTGGYWSADAESLPLLHTWSLSLEEQFYLLYPLLLVALFTLRRPWLPSALWAVFLASLVLCVVATTTHQKAAFYLLPTRMWELLAGALLALHERRLTAHRAFGFVAPLLAVAGLGGLLIAFVFTDSSGFPGWLPLLPCVCTAALICAAEHHPWVARLLSARPMVYTGRISYSLYLWHWPVIVFSLYLTPSGPALWLLAVLYALAVLSYHGVEAPLRSGSRRTRPLLVGLPAAACTCLAPLALWRTGPWLPPDLADLETPAALSQGWTYDATEAVRRGAGGIAVGPAGDRLGFVLLGSSHARVLAAPFAAYAEARGVRGLIMATPGVHLTLQAVDGRRADTDELNAARLRFLRENPPELIVVAEMWSAQTDQPDFTQRLQQRLRELAATGSRIVVTAQVPMCELPGRYHQSLRKYLLASARSAVPPLLAPAGEVARANQTLRAAIEALEDPRIRFVDIHRSLLRPDGAIAALDQGMLRYYDSHHVNDRGADTVFRDALQPILDQHWGVTPSPVLAHTGAR